MYPIVEYARKIGKNTADLTASDMSRFTAWWMKKPIRADVEKLIKQQLIRATQVHEEIELNKKEDKIMVKKHNMAKFQAAQRSRLTSDKVVDVEQADEDIAAAMAEEEENQGVEIVEEEDGQEVELQKINDVIAKSDIVCSLELTKLDVMSLIWGLETLLKDYDLDENEFGESVKSVLSGLKEICSKEE